MSSRAKKYRAREAECVHRAMAAINPIVRLEFMDVAREWQHLAAEVIDMAQGWQNLAEDVLELEYAQRKLTGRSAQGPE